MTVAIRPYRNLDFESYKRILAATDLFLEGYDSRENFSRQAEHDPCSILIAEEDGQVVGGVIVLYQPWVSLVYHLCVEPGRQKQGVGTQLLDAVEANLRSRGTYSVGCYVKEGDDKLVEMYEKMGFVASEPAIPMGRSVDPGE